MKNDEELTVHNPENHEISDIQSNPASNLVDMLNNSDLDNKTKAETLVKMAEMYFNASENEKNREHEAREKEKERQYNALEKEKERQYETLEKEKEREYATIENESARAYMTREQEKVREHETNEQEKARKYKATEEEKAREHDTREKKKAREHEAKENRKARGFSWFLKFTPLLIVIAVVLICVAVRLGPNIGRIPVPSGSKDYVGQDYEDVKTSLSDAGFKNIVEIPLEDLSDGFLNGITKTFRGDKNGVVEQISINGHTSFKKGEEFSKNATIRITYHSYPEEIE